MLHEPRVVHDGRAGDRARADVPAEGWILSERQHGGLRPVGGLGAPAPLPTRGPRPGAGHGVESVGVVLRGRGLAAAVPGLPQLAWKRGRPLRVAEGPRAWVGGEVGEHPATLRHRRGLGRGVPLRTVVAQGAVVTEGAVGTGLPCVVVVGARGGGSGALQVARGGGHAVKAAHAIAPGRRCPRRVLRGVPRRLVLVGREVVAAGCLAGRGHGTAAVCPEFRRSAISSGRT